MLTCPVIKLTDKFQNWARNDANYLESTDELFQLYNKDNEIVKGLRFYFPMEIHTDDKLKKQDKVLVLELIKGNNDDLFLAYYNFDEKRYDPTHIKFKRVFKATIRLIKYVLARFIKQN